MKPKYMKMLKDELRKIQRDFGRRIKYFSGHLNGLDYYVILKDRRSFYITLGTDHFPDIRFRDIVYIIKRNDEHDYEYTDTDSGNLNMNVYEHGAYVREKERQYRADPYQVIDTGEWD